MEYGYIYSELVKKTKIPSGTKLKILKKDAIEGGLEKRIVKVVEEYKHHVLLDFGAYKECRRKVDIALGICDAIG